MSGEQGNSDQFSESLLEAARWRIRLTELGVESTLHFEAWLAKPLNAAAWSQISVSWDIFGRKLSAPELVTARRAALEDAKRAGAQRRWPRDWRRTVGGIAAIVVFGIVVWGGIHWSESADDYMTILGERRVITLSDGSRVSLDSSSEVTVRYTDSARLLKLLRGQARFDVTHDVERPFSVLAGAQKVIATGTAFNINLIGSRVLVTLIEGHVVVIDEKSVLPMPGDTKPAQRHQSVELKAGQQLAALPAEAPEIGPANVQRVTAWMSGQLMIDDEPLSEVVAQLNRYSLTPIEIRDPEIAAMRISGVFNTGDVVGMVDILTHYLPVRAVSKPEGIIILERNAKG